MPFALAHVAAVLPLARRKKFVWSALVVGAIAPDFQYLFHQHQTRLWHRYPGVFLITIPLAAAVLTVFHLLVKEPLVEILPRRMEARLRPGLQRFTWFGDASNFLWIWISLLTGVLAHLLWDKVTHRNSFITDWVPILYHQRDMGSLGIVSGFTVLQAVSSIVGTALVAFFAWRWWKALVPDEAIEARWSEGSKAAILSSMLWGALVVSAIRCTLGVVQESSLLELTAIGTMAFLRVFLWESVAFGAAVTFYRRLRYDDREQRVEVNRGKQQRLS